MFKKIIFVTLALCLAFSCVSCAGFSGAESKEIASKLVGKTFKGKIEFEYAEDWEVTWEFGEKTVLVTIDSIDKKGIPYSDVKEFQYKVTGSYKKAWVKFPGIDNWNDLLIGFDTKQNVSVLEHTDSVDTTRFYLDD